jgi:hypothetical protein
MADGISSAFKGLSSLMFREWSKLHYEKLNDLYSLTSIVRVIKTRMKWAGHVARMGEKRSLYRSLVGKPE